MLRVSRSSKTVGGDIAFASVAIERLTGFVALPLLTLVGFIVKPSLLELPHAWVAVVISGVTVAALVVVLFVAGHPDLAGRFESHENWMRFVGAVHTGVDRLRREPRRSAGVLGAAVAYQASVVAAVWCAVHALGVSIPDGAVIAFIPAVAMAQVLPISLGGLGIREGLLVLLLHPLGVPTGKAIGVGLLWYGMTLFVSLLGAPAFAVGHRHGDDGEDGEDGGKGIAGDTSEDGVPLDTAAGDSDDDPMSVAEREPEPARPAAALEPAPIRRRLPGGRRLRDGHHLYWWVELLAVGAFYFVYSAIRNLNDSNAAEAFQHARELIDLQKTLGIDVEQSIQAWALGVRPLIVFANYFYGSFHFIVTGGVMIYLFRKWTNDYPTWRNTLAASTGIALDRLRAVPADAAAAAPGALRRPAGARVQGRILLRGHAREGSRLLVVQFRRGEQDLQPVRGDAQRPLRVGVVVRLRARPAAPAPVGEAARRAVSRPDGDGHRRERQSLPPRRGRRVRRVRDRLPARARLHTRRPR